MAGEIYSNDTVDNMDGNFYYPRNPIGHSPVSVARKFERVPQVPGQDPYAQKRVKSDWSRLSRSDGRQVRY